MHCDSLDQRSYRHFLFNRFIGFILVSLRFVFRGLVVCPFPIPAAPFAMLYVSIDSQRPEVFDLMGSGGSYQPDKCILFSRSGSGGNHLSVSCYVHSPGK